MPDFLLDIKGLETQFKTPDGIVHAVNGVSFGLKEGETLGVVGESGCGKSVTMLSVMGLIPSPPGKVMSGGIFFWPGSFENACGGDASRTGCADQHGVSGPDDFAKPCSYGGQAIGRASDAACGHVPQSGSG